MLGQQEPGFDAPSGWHCDFTVGDLRGWILRTFTALEDPGLETTTVMSEPTFSGFLPSSALRFTVPPTPALRSDFLGQPFAQDAETVEPPGTFLTTKDVNFVCFLV